MDDNQDHYPLALERRDPSQLFIRWSDGHEQFDWLASAAGLLPLCDLSRPSDEATSQQQFADLNSRRNHAVANPWHATRRQLRLQHPI